MDYECMAETILSYQQLDKYMSIPAVISFLKELKTIHGQSDENSPNVPMQVYKRKEDEEMESLDELKKKIVNKYAITAIDPNKPQDSFKPKVVIDEKKVLVRYRDNQIATTKGEKIIVQKPEMTEELKKTYINLKPARKYRFH